MPIYRLMFFIALWLSAPIWVNGQTDQVSPEVVTDYSLYQSLTFTANTISIPYNHSKVKISYNGFQALGDTLYFHDQASNQILFFDWKQGKVLPALQLNPLVGDIEKLYPGDVNDVLMVSSDSIWVVQNYRLTLVNAKGKMVNHWNIDDPNLFEELVAHGVWYKTFNIIFKPEGKVYIHRMSAACSNGDFSFCCNYSIEAVMDLQTGNVDTLPMLYSPHYKTRNYGHLREVGRIELENKHIYTFQSDPNLYILNLQTDSITVVGAQSKHQTADTLYCSHEKVIEMQWVMDHYMQGQEYSGLWHDPYQNLIFRFYRAQQPLTNTKGKPNGIMDKDLYLQVFDTELNMLGEIHLGNSYGQWAFVTPDGFMVSKMSPNNPEHDKKRLLFDAIKIVK